MWNIAATEDPEETAQPKNEAKPRFLRKSSAPGVRTPPLITSYNIGNVKIIVLIGLLQV